MYHGQFENQRSTQPARKKKKKKKRTPLALRILLWFLVIILVLAGAAFAYVNIVLGKIDRSEILGDESLSIEDIWADEILHSDQEDSVDQMAAMQAALPTNVDLLDSADTETILLVGSDTRGGGDVGRADTIMLVTLDYESGEIHLASLMRALYVCIPKSSGDTWFALNASYAWGGIDLLIDTIELNFKVGVDNYAVVDFSAFKKAIDVVGGVDIELTQGEANYVSTQTGTYVVAGLNHLNGEQALAYSRCRSLDSDFARTSRQRTVITALLDKASSCSLGELNNLAMEILPMVNTDMSNTEILGHAASFLSMGSYEIDQLMIPIENMSGLTFEGIMYVNGAELYSYDVEENLSTLHEFMGG